MKTLDMRKLMDRLQENERLEAEQARLEGDYASFDEALVEGDDKPYICVHAKKGKHECHASSSYEAAKKAAKAWGLKSTAGIDAHLAVEESKSEEVDEAVGESAECFYELQDDFCGGECPSGGHKTLIDEMVRFMTGDQLQEFCDDFRRQYDMND